MPAVLIATTGTESMPNIDRHLGIPLSQWGRTRSTFGRAGWDVVLVSPSGGDVPFDRGSLSEEWIQAGAVAQPTTSMSAVRVDDFRAVLVLGGHGAMVDLVPNTELHAMLWAFADNGKPIGALDHGAAVLAAARDLHGSLIKGVAVTGRSDEEEQLAGHHDLIDLSAESVLRAAGSLYSAGPPWLPNVVVDGLIVTGQNPGSAMETVEALLAVAAGGESLAA